MGVPHREDRAFVRPAHVAVDLALRGVAADEDGVHQARLVLDRPPAREPQRLPVVLVEEIERDVELLQRRPARVVHDDVVRPVVQRVLEIRERLPLREEDAVRHEVRDRDHGARAALGVGPALVKVVVAVGRGAFTQAELRPLAAAAGVAGHHPDAVRALEPEVAEPGAVRVVDEDARVEFALVVEERERDVQAPLARVALRETALRREVVVEVVLDVVDARVLDQEAQRLPQVRAVLRLQNVEVPLVAARPPELALETLLVGGKVTHIEAGLQGPVRPVERDPRPEASIRRLERRGDLRERLVRRVDLRLEDALVCLRVLPAVVGDHGVELHPVTPELRGHRLVRLLDERLDGDALGLVAVPVVEVQIAARGLARLGDVVKEREFRVLSPSPADSEHRAFARDAPRPVRPPVRRAGEVEEAHEPPARRELAVAPLEVDHVVPTVLEVRLLEAVAVAAVEAGVVHPEEPVADEDGLPVPAPRGLALCREAQDLKTVDGAAFGHVERDGLVDEGPVAELVPHRHAPRCAGIDAGLRPIRYHARLSAIPACERRRADRLVVVVRRRPEGRGRDGGDRRERDGCSGIPHFRPPFLATSARIFLMDSCEIEMNLP